MVPTQPVGENIGSNSPQRKRQKNVEEELIPILYGTTSRRADRYGIDISEIYSEEATHKWCIYLVHCHNEDMSPYVRKVIFQMNQGCEYPIRSCFRPPYEVTQYGNFEFEATITVYFHDIYRNPVSFKHTVKLIPDDVSGDSSNKYLVCERFNKFMIEKQPNRIPKIIPLWLPLERNMLSTYINEKKNCLWTFILKEKMIRFRNSLRRIESEVEREQLVLGYRPARKYDDSDDNFEYLGN